jgi:RHS repeat-associated protein
MSEGGYRDYWRDAWAFDSYGMQLLRSDVSGSLTGPITVGFAGQQGGYYDTDENSVLMTHRWYDPGTGRFVNRDPIGYGGGLNVYGFAGNNPVTHSDPTGYDPGIEIHHLLMQCLGGLNDKENLIAMQTQEHRALHADMRTYMKQMFDFDGNPVPVDCDGNPIAEGNSMQPVRGYKGSDIQETFSPQAIRNAFTQFYQKVSTKYPEASSQFLNKWGATVKSDMATIGSNLQDEAQELGGDLKVVGSDIVDGDFSAIGADTEPIAQFVVEKRAP